MRKTSFTAGILYLLTFVSIPTLALYSTVKSTGYVTGSGPDVTAIAGALLEIIVALACIGTAVVLFPFLKKQSETLALGFVALRVLEAGLIFVGVAMLLSVVALRQMGIGEGALIPGEVLVTLYDKIFLVSQSFLPAFNDLLLGILLFQSRLVPRTLAMVGIVGVFPLLAGFVMMMFGTIVQGGSLAGLAALPVALFELSLGLWLVLKGFNQKAVKTLMESR